MDLGLASSKLAKTPEPTRIKRGREADKHSDDVVEVVGHLSKLVLNHDQQI